VTRRAINASELKDFSFCQRAWYLEQIGTPSEIEDQRRAGTIDHQEHAEHVERSTQREENLTGVMLLGVLVLVLVIVVVVLCAIYL